jgi:hypothetical protein
MKIKKYFVVVMIIAVILSNFSMKTYAADDIVVYYNDVKVDFDIAPVIFDGRTMVPMRAIFEAFGAFVEYVQETKQIIVKKEKLEIILTIGSKNASIIELGAKRECTLDAPPYAIAGRTVVPIRFISESLGAKVEWNGQTRTVYINKSPDSVIQNTIRTVIMDPTDIAKYLKPRSVIVNCYNINHDLQKTGSGFFINEKGYIATNYHVTEGAAKVTFILSNGQEFAANRVVYADKVKDLIVYQIINGYTPYVTFGDSSIVETGNRIFTYGSPQGISYMISDGLISNSDYVIDGKHYILLTAPVSPGSSGGCLLDECGNVIGITSISFTDAQNINAAIPINTLKSLVNGSELEYKTITSDEGTYEGYLSSSEFHYNGTFVWTNGDIYSGDWYYGDQSGYGIYEWANGDIYEGDFVGGELYGIGTYLWNDGTEYYGDWVNGDRTGYGYMYFPSGDEYLGYFVNGKFDGNGTYRYSNGMVINGYWNNGVLISSD